MLNKLINWIKTIKIRDIVFVCIIILLFLFLTNLCGRYSDLERRYDNNITALTDTISYYESKNGSLIATKTAYESDIKELKHVNNKLYQEIADFKIKLKNVSSGVNFGGEIVYLPGDTCYLVKQDTIYAGFTKEFNFSNDWRKLSGDIKYKPDSLSLTFKEDKVLFDYTIVMDKNNKIYIKSKNPYVSYNEMTGFTVPKQRPKRWGLSLYGGYGFDVINKKFNPNLGIAVTWDIFQW